ncbi:radical SAM protein [Blastopirellula retiformator]|uniref:Antilisterial bacteriocin subtilosin biosynthesis protein AlbA n=1 Tax=Blastopirellula retiformator TaxID=2527970 RepID=A0A5C5UZA9_9BACT|nr:radical SAM protein [Blastopirellula retiformator]TWT31694.1 Antilisterial bacteriocin subtilosin biosynthesis protein AlbA [Blastopirellula retiformator]
MPSGESPQVDPSHLDALWFQVTGLRCNLACRHCFVSCHPKNDTFGFLTLEQVESRLQEAAKLGVKEFYFTGGEPFLHPQIVPMLIAALRYGPVTVLTNGTVLKAQWLQQLWSAEDQGIYSLEFRVSIDGFSPATNDPIRGAGTFDRAMRGVQLLVEHDFLPIITAVRTWPDAEEAEVVANFAAVLRDIGYTRPRIKLLPTLQLGAEETRSCGYGQHDRITAEMWAGFDATQLVCEHSRVVSDRGVHVCPILVEAPDSLLGETLAESLRPFPLAHGACFTCYQFGSICANPSTAAGTGNGS